MTATMLQTARLSGGEFSRWRFAKPFFASATVILLLVPLKYLPGFVAENLGEDAVGGFMIVAAVALTVFGLFSSLISILVADCLLLASLKIFGADVIFRDVGPVLRRAFFVYACGLICISAYLLLGDGWDIYRTPFPDVIMGVTIVFHVAEIYRSLSAWGIPGRARKVGIAAVYCAIPALILGALAVIPQQMLG